MRQIPNDSNITRNCLIDRSMDSWLSLLLSLLLLRSQFNSLLLLFLQCFKLLISLVCLVQAVSCISHHLVDKSLVNISLENLFKIKSVFLMNPEGRKYFIHEKSILEFCVKLMRCSSHSNVTVKSNEANWKICMSYQIAFKDFIHDSRFFTLQKVEQKLYKISSKVGIGSDLNLRKQ